MIFLVWLIRSEMTGPYDVVLVEIGSTMDPIWNVWEMMVVVSDLSFFLSSGAVFGFDTLVSYPYICFR